VSLSGAYVDFFERYFLNLREYESNCVPELEPLALPASLWSAATWLACSAGPSTRCVCSLRAWVPTGLGPQAASLRVRTALPWVQPGCNLSNRRCAQNEVAISFLVVNPHPSTLPA